MKKSTKGAIAAGAAGVLLLGGVGSLAYWTDSVEIGGGKINAGEMSLTDTTGADDDCTAAPWAFSTDDVEQPLTTEYVDGDTIVPGDILVKECTFTIAASGKHLRGVVTPEGGANTGSLGGDDVIVGAAYTVDGDERTNNTITATDDADELKATITLTFNYGTDEAGAPVISGNVTQNKIVDISNYTLAVTQEHLPD